MLLFRFLCFLRRIVSKFHGEKKSLKLVRLPPFVSLTCAHNLVDTIGSVVSWRADQSHGRAGQFAARSLHGRASRQPQNGDARAVASWPSRIHYRSSFGCAPISAGVESPRKDGWRWIAKHIAFNLWKSNLSMLENNAINLMTLTVYFSLVAHWTQNYSY